MNINSEKFVIIHDDDEAKGHSNSQVENKLTSPWPKQKKTNRQTNVHKTQYRKLKTEQHEPHQKLWVILGTLKG